MSGTDIDRTAAGASTGESPSALPVAETGASSGIPTDRLFGFPVHLVDEASALNVVKTALAENRNLHVVTLNPEMIMQGEKDPEAGDILRNAELVLPDGVGVVWALRRRGHPIKRLPGIEFSESVLALAAREGYPVAIVGATEEALTLAVNTLCERYPGLNIAYAHHGFFKADTAEEDSIVQACAEARPRIVLVALGVPRQEKWIAKHRPRFSGTIFIGVGGSLDVWSGLTRRAPDLMRRLNLEWLYRITTEPWRIKRTYKTLPMFAIKVWFHQDRTGLRTGERDDTHRADPSDRREEP